MSVIIARDLVVTTPTGYDDVTGDNPIIGYHTLVDYSTITSTYANASYPISNVANPSTANQQIWKSTVNTVQYITIPNLGAQQPDYIGIAKHNFGTDQSSITIEQYNGVAWTTLVGTFIPATDAPLFIRFNEVLEEIISIRIKIEPNSAIPYVGVVYCGRLLLLPRRIYVPHTPITMGRQTVIANGMSESGNFLGRIITGESRATNFSQRYVSPIFYRTKFEPFAAVAQEKPFFFAWRPATYPAEVGYCWLNNDLKPANQLPNGMMQVDFSVSGIAP